MNRKLLALIIPAALLLGACSQSNNPTADSSTGSAALKGVSASIFDLPSSVAAAEPSVQLSGTTALAKTGVVATGEEVAGLAAYQAVPLYVHLAETVKDSVRALIENLAAQDLPDSFDGDWNGYKVKLWSVDSLFENDNGKIFTLIMKKDGITTLKLHYARNARSQYRGSCYYLSDKGDSTAVLLRFNTFNEGVLGKRMTLWVTRPESQLEDVNGPSVLRVRAVETPAGRIIVTGVSYHPLFAQDSFWTDGPKVYAFRAVTNPTKDQGILRVAFADADSIDGDFFTKHSLDKEVATRATEILKDSMTVNAAMAKYFFYSLEQNKALADFSPTDLIALTTYEPTRTVESLTAADLKAYLTINSASILAGTDAGSKVLYFHVMVEQPIFLSAAATIVGYASAVPANFSVAASEIDDSAIVDESPVTVGATTITEDDTNNDATDL